jgi:hypothetical protein
VEIELACILRFFGWGNGINVTNLSCAGYTIAFMIIHGFPIDSVGELSELMRNLCMSERIVFGVETLQWLGLEKYGWE